LGTLTHGLVDIRFFAVWLSRELQFLLSFETLPSLFIIVLKITFSISMFCTYLRAKNRSHDDVVISKFDEELHSGQTLFSVFDVIEIAGQPQ